MEKLKVLQERKDGVLERMNAILDAAISEEREKTEEEEKEYLSLETKLEKLEKDMELAKRLAEIEAETSRPSKSLRLSTKAQKTDPK